MGLTRPQSFQSLSKLNTFDPGLVRLFNNLGDSSEICQSVGWPVGHSACHSAGQLACCLIGLLFGRPACQLT